MQSGNTLCSDAIPRVALAYERWVGWMTPFSSTTATGGWMERHPPYVSHVITGDPTRAKRCYNCLLAQRDRQS
jgi:mannose/cellobiose epimerase-like protein (N-acyl-D-glucosamine 2-epimerase family)